MHAKQSKIAGEVLVTRKYRETKDKQGPQQVILLNSIIEVNKLTTQNLCLEMRTKVQWKPDIKCALKAKPHSIRRSYEDRDSHNVCLLVCAR